MKLNEILESGLLELYVLGKLSGDELRIIEEALAQYPSLKGELLEIERALFKYDNLHKITPPSSACMYVPSVTYLRTDTQTRPVILFVPHQDAFDPLSIVQFHD